MTNTLGEWRWVGAEQQLEMTVQAGHELSMLDGRWALADFRLLLDGLSQSRIERSLQAGNSSVACELRLADGQAVEMVGAFTENAIAQGILLERSDQVGEDDEPGPELVPVFQPILSLNTGHVVGFEALARWPTSSGDISGKGHQRFDDKALASNMLIHACQALSVWRDKAGREDVFVQVNLTSRDLVDDRLVDLVSALISGYNLAPGTLRLELTEQAALRDTNRAIEVATALREAGAALVLDDFGSGHSSFLWLANLPADSLKIDSDLVAQIRKDRVKTILEALTLLARRLGMRTTAEGVEDTAILPLLQEIGFDYAQGFALGRPMTQDAASLYLIERG